MSAVTCVARGDIAEYLLEREGTEAVRYGQIMRWPDGWTEHESAARVAWREWNEARLAGMASDDDGEAAREYYRQHRATMTQGMEVSWPERVAPNDVDALYTAIWDYHDLGEAAFMAERQNQPLAETITLYNLSPSVILGRVDNNRAANDLPEWARTVILSTDINRSYAISNVLLAFGADQRAAVLDYWQTPIAANDEMTPAEIKRIAIEGLGTVGRQVLARPHLPRLWVIDGGGTPQDTVNDFAGVSVRSFGLQAIAAYGRGSRNYRPTAPGKGRGRSDAEEAHIVIDGMRRWAIWNADYWREQAQRGWTGTLGAPGTVDLPAGRHMGFAEEICREQLVGKNEVGGKMIWLWNTLPGAHDYGDCMAQGYMGAALLGIGTGGANASRQGDAARRRRRKGGVAWA
jgi:hypothetical protein